MSREQNPGCCFLGRQAWLGGAKTRSLRGVCVCVGGGLLSGVVYARVLSLLDYKKTCLPALRACISTPNILLPNTHEPVHNNKQTCTRSRRAKALPEVFEGAVGSSPPNLLKQPQHMVLLSRGSDALRTNMEVLKDR